MTEISTLVTAATLDIMEFACILGEQAEGILDALQEGDAAIDQHRHLNDIASMAESLRETARRTADLILSEWTAKEYRRRYGVVPVPVAAE